ncbi:MAG: hypothetical protein NC238_05810 [Dehalobacter sp.]|nr:hypothetical protein [Dehalobacter sp.]
MLQQVIRTQEVDSSESFPVLRLIGAIAAAGLGLFLAAWPSIVNPIAILSGLILLLLGVVIFRLSF